MCYPPYKFSLVTGGAAPHTRICKFVSASMLGTLVRPASFQALRRNSNLGFIRFLCAHLEYLGTVLVSIPLSAVIVVAAAGRHRLLTPWMRACWFLPMPLYVAWYSLLLQLAATLDDTLEDMAGLQVKLNYRGVMSSWRRSLGTCSPIKHPSFQP